MAKVLRKYYIMMAIMLIPNIFSIVATTYRTNYSITAPGGTSYVDARFDIEDGYESDNNLLSLFVYSFDNSTLFQNMYAKLNSTYDVDKISNSYSHMTDALWRKSGIILKNQSEESSLINAYSLASVNNSNITINYDYLGVIVYITSATNTIFQIGDIITHVSNTKIESRNHYIELLYKEETNKTFTINRDDEILTVDAIEDMTKNHNIYDKFIINDATPNYKLNSTSSTGPSAGMMQTLSIYNQLVEEDITIKDGNKLLIAGTGTIESNGTIGNIGGVKQKVYSAFKSGANILIVPKGNYEEALETYNTIYKKELMTLLTFDTVSEVIEWLK